MSSSSDQTTALQYALLASGAIPEQSSAIVDPTENPDRESGGYSVLGSLRALVQVSTRLSGAHRVAVITFQTVDLTCNYTTDLSGVTNTYNATAGTPADLEELLEQWAASINAHAPSAAIVTATSTATQLRLEWLDAIATGIEVTQDSAAALTVTTEYEGCTGYLVERASVRNTTGDTTLDALWAGWQVHTDGAFDGSITITQGLGYRTMVNCAGRAAMMVYIPPATLTGHADDAGSAGCTLAYSGPYGIVAPVVAH